jgi:hypothetical protein
MEVYIDDKLKNTKLEDEDGNPIPFDKMTAEQKQIYYFQQWWSENGDNIMKLFGSGGKYESTDIHFKLGTQTKGREFNIALTTFGKKDTPLEDLNRGRYETKVDFGIDDLKMAVWLNPNQKPNSSTNPHEWKHVQIIFNAVQEEKPIPAAGSAWSPEEGTQHWLIQRGLEPKIK